MWSLGMMYVSSSCRWCLMALGALSPLHQAGGRHPQESQWSEVPGPPCKKIITYFSMWLFLILGRALILKNAKLCSQTFEIASWSGARKLPMAFKTMRRHCVWRRQTGFPLHCWWAWSWNSTRKAWTCYEKVTKMFKMYGGILKSIDPNRLTRQLAREKAV